MWNAGIFVCLLEAAGVVAIVRSIPNSFASIPDAMTRSAPQAAASGAEGMEADDPQANPDAMPAAVTPRRRMPCQECGTIASIREVEVLRDAGWQDSVDRRFSKHIASGPAGRAIVRDPASARLYEITIRFRDGKTTVFNESGTPTWRIGNRVIVIGGARPSKG